MESVALVWKNLAMLSANINGFLKDLFACKGFDERHLFCDLSQLISWQHSYLPAYRFDAVTTW